MIGEFTSSSENAVGDSYKQQPALRAGLGAAASATMGPAGLAIQGLLGNQAVRDMIAAGQRLVDDPRQYGEDYADGYTDDVRIYNDYGQDSVYYRHSDGYQGSGYEGSGYEGAGYEGNGTLPDGYQGQGYEGQGYEGQGYEGQGTGVAENPPAAGITTPVDPEKMFESLDFDPNGMSEEWVAALNPIDAIMVLQARDQAFEMTAQMFPDQGAHNNDADAFRHAYWNYIMTQNIGGSEAKKFGDAHERYSQNEMGETLMDLYNNNIGRTLAQDPENEGRPPEEVIMEAIANGTLQTAPIPVQQGTP